METVLEYTAQHPDACIFYSELERMAQNLLNINVVTLNLCTSCFFPLPVYETGFRPSEQTFPFFSFLRSCWTLFGRIQTVSGNS